jgi:hypothetical protein
VIYQHNLGSFKDQEDAARVYDRSARAQLGEKAQLNFPTKKEQAAEEAKQQQWIKCVDAGSKYRGVSWHKSCNKWAANIWYDGKQHYLGTFEDEKEAAKQQGRTTELHDASGSAFSIARNRSDSIYIKNRRMSSKNRPKRREAHSSSFKLDYKLFAVRL